MDSAPLSISLFGPFAVSVRDQPMPRLRSRSIAWLLGLLVLRHGRAVSRAALAGTLWPESRQERALLNLRGSLVELRRALGSEAARLRSPTRDTLLLDLTGAAVDLLRFDAAIAAGDEGSLHAAVSLYRGPLLEGCAAEWILGDRQARGEACLQALEKLADRALAAGDAPAALGHLLEAEALDPLRDSVQQRRMQALAASGDLPAALFSYRDYRLRLHREMNLEPDPETTRLFRELQAGRRPGRGDGATGGRGEPAESATAPVLTLPAPPVSPSPCPPVVPSPLPRPLTALIGREQELREATRLVVSSRLVTLIGGGGVGKTRLALQVAAGLAGEYPGRTSFVELAPLAAPPSSGYPALLSAFVAAALGLPEPAAPEPQSPGAPGAGGLALIGWLSHQPALLVLDNCEHLIDAAAELAQSLLAACPELRILATSRQRLGLTGEIAWRVPSLPAPDPERLPMDAPGAVEHVLQFPAAQLLVERAAAVRSGFQLRDRDEALAVARICQRLDGIPLALELAAARVTVLGVSQIAARLDNRFRLLTGGSHAALPRHQTLRALIDWSYEGLPAEEAALLRRLSVFTGGWTLEAAEAVSGGVQVFGRSGAQADKDSPDFDSAAPEHLNTRTPEHPDDVLDRLGSLESRSLVLVEEAGEARFDAAGVSAGGRAPGQGLRYRMLETVREYAGEKLRECGEEATARSDHAAYFLKLAETAEAAIHGPGQLRWLNALEAEHDNLRAGLAWCLEAVGSGQWSVASPAPWVPGQWSAVDPGPSGPTTGSPLSELMTDRVPAERVGPLATAIEAVLLLAPAVKPLWAMRHYMAEGRQYLDALLSSPQAAGRTAARAAALYATGKLALLQGDFAAARAQGAESLAIGEELGDQLGIARALDLLSSLASSGEEERLLATRSLALFREANDSNGAAIALTHLSTLASAEQDHDAARALQREALSIARSRGDRMLEATCLSRLAAIEYDRRDYAAARVYSRGSLALARELGMHNQTAVSLYFLGLLAFQEGDFAAARSLWEECREVDRRNRNKGGSVLGALAELAAVQGDTATARARWEESLAEGRELGRADLVVRTLRGLGDAARLEGDTAGALRRYSESLQAVQAAASRPEIKIADERYQAECAACLRGIAAALSRPGKEAQATRLLGAAEAMAEAVGAALPAAARPGYDLQIAALRQTLGEEAFAAAWAGGRAMSLEAAALYALGEQSPA